MVSFPITLPEIREAYRVTQLTPHPGVWLCDDDADPMGAMFASRHGRAALEALLLLEHATDGLGLTKGELIAFTDGFDYVDANPYASPNYFRAMAYEAGKAAREALCPLEKEVAR